MQNIYKAEVFKMEDGSLIPGESWPNAVNMVRHRDHLTGRSRQEIFRLGVALGGAASVLEDIHVDLDVFKAAAVPPMQGAEARDFHNGYEHANAMLGNTIGAHMQPEPANEGVRRV